MNNIKQTLILSLVIIAILMVPNDFEFLAPSLLPNTQASTADGWYPVIQRYTNAYFMWSDSPITRLSKMLHPELNATLPYKISIIIFLLGALILFRQISNTPQSLAHIVNATLLSLLLLIVFGCDDTLIMSLAWMPWVMGILVSPVMKEKRWLLILSGLLSADLFFVAGSNQLSILLLPFAFILANKAQSAEHTQAGSSLAWLLPLCMIPACLTLYHAPTPPFPNYPAATLAHLVPDDGLPGMIRPLIGPDLPLPVIDRNAIKAAYGPLATCLAILSLALYLLTRGLASKPIMATASIASLLSVSAWIDTKLSESLSQIGPIAAISQIVPQLFLIPLTPVILALCLLTLFLIVSMTGKVRLSLLISAVLVALCVFKLSPGQLSRVNMISITNSSHAREVALSNPNSLSAKITRAILSPSHYLLRTVGPAAVARQLSLNNAAFEKLSSQEVKITASHNNKPELLAQLVNGEIGKDRWSASRGFQNGDEWLHLKFQNKIRLAGLQLSSGAYTSDFPRGLRISWSSKCSDAPTPEPTIFKTYQPIIDYPSWQGEVNFSEDAYPYFSGQEKMKIFFPRDILVDCLLIEQTAQAPAFDWSVSEIKVLPATH